MTESHIRVSEGNFTSFVGPDAVHLFRAKTIKSGLIMYANCGMKPNRAYTPSAMLKVAGEYTGKTYKRGQYRQAADDLQVWISTMLSALPVVEG